METQQNSTTNSHLKNPEQLTENETQQLIQKLENLCSRIDPFGELAQKDREQLKAWGIEWENPFELTNKLVKWLEDMIELRENQKRQ